MRHFLFWCSNARLTELTVVWPVSEFSHLLGYLRDLTHGANPWRREWTALSLKVNQDFLDNIAKFTVERDGVIAMYSRYEVRALSDIHLIIITPLHPFVVSVQVFPLLTVSIA